MVASMALPMVVSMADESVGPLGKHWDASTVVRRVAGWVVLLGSEMAVSKAVRKALLSVGGMGQWTVDWWVSPLEDTKVGTSAKRQAAV